MQDNDSEEPEFGILYTPKRHRTFTKGMRILAAYPTTLDPETGELVSFDTKGIDTDMIAHVARVYPRTEAGDRSGGVSKEDRRWLKRHGWRLDGAWEFYLATYPDPYK